MKKILVVLSLFCFVAVNVTNAQTSASTPAAKTEKKEAVSSTSTPGCSHATVTSCCKKGNMKACTPEEKAQCEAKKAKADASKTDAEANKAKADADKAKADADKAKAEANAAKAEPAPVKN